MKAMILAAGEGRRMHPLTLTTPKPLLPVKRKPLIVHHILRLKQAGITDIIINVAYLGEKIKAALGDGKQFDVTITYSSEPQPLETAGALLFASHLLGDAPFLLVNGDVWTDYPLQQLARRETPVGGGHLILVPNPEFKTTGDFLPNAAGRITAVGTGYTFAGLSKLSPDLIKKYPQPKQTLALREVFTWAVGAGALTAELYNGLWVDVGTPQRLALVNQL